MILCSECQYAKTEYGGQEYCKNNLSDFYGELMDKGEGCKYGKLKKSVKPNLQDQVVAKNTTTKNSKITEYEKGKVATNGEGKIGLFIAFFNNVIYQNNGKAVVFTDSKKAKNWLNKVNQLGIGNYEIRKVVI